MSKNPLDDAFSVSDKNFLDDDFAGVTIPDDPTLDTIVSLALRAYKEQMDDVMHIEPKNRARYLEVAEKFLNQAKDALAKKEQIKAVRDKMVSPKGGKAPTSSSEAVSGVEGGVGLSRRELLDQVNLKVVK